MTNTETISWIFLSIAFASENQKADLKAISNIADGINHSIPNQSEMKNSIDWLMNKRLISRMENKFELTDLGKIEIKKASENSDVIFKIWKKLDVSLVKIGEVN